ncbi:MAG TPA: PAS domain-containing protein, partial [Sporichthya sp.]|nr:PAS domain-containing protein [Sporichthya sp.]
MNGVPGAADFLRLLTTLPEATASGTSLEPVLQFLVEAGRARTVAMTGPDGEVAAAAHRRGAGGELDPAGFHLDVDHDDPAIWRTVEVPPPWAAAGVVDLGAHRMPSGLGSLVVAWDAPPAEAEVAWIQSMFALLGEHVARQRSETELADLTARVQHAQQQANMGDYDWHIASDTNQWSDQLFRIYGHEPQSFNASYERFLAHIHPDDRERIQEIHRVAYETGEPYQMVERIIRPDGEVRFLSSNGQVMRDAFGTPVRMRGTCVDITDRVLAEQARERLAARFRGLVESCPDAILVLDPEGIVVHANRGAHDLLGGDPTDHHVESFSAFFRSAGHDVRARTLEGLPILLDVVVADLNEVDQESLTAVYLRDATLRRNDEARAAALRETQVRHRQALEINDDVIQGLTAAIFAMQQDDVAAGTAYLEKTLAAARRLMNDWSPAAEQNRGIRPGSLVRSRASALPQQAQPGPSAAAPAPAPAAAPRILVVDDNDDVRMLLCAQLRALGKGTVVGQAADGAEAVRLAAELQPDLVFLDLSMPDMDGLEALPRILDSVPGVKVVVMSGFDESTVA